MAKNNRSEAKAAVTANIAATVTVAKHTEVLNNQILDGAVMEKDLISTFSGTSGTLNASYTTYTQLIANLTGDATFNILNVQDGGRYKLIVNKGVSDNVVFSGVTETMLGQIIGKTVLHFEIWSANSKVYVSQINRQTGQNILLADLSCNAGSTSGTIDSVVHGRWTINDNMLYYEVSGTLSIPSTGGLAPGTIDIDIDNIPATPVYEDFNLPAMSYINATSEGTRGAFAKYASSTGILTVSYSIANPTTGLTLSGSTFVIGGSIKIQ